MWPTIIVLAVILALVALAVTSIVKDKKAGKCSCGNQCSSCAMNCELSSSRSISSRSLDAGDSTGATADLEA